MAWTWEHRRLPIPWEPADPDTLGAFHCTHTVRALILLEPETLEPALRL